MSSPLPYSFVSIQEARESHINSYVSVIGIVVDALEPTHTKGSSFVSTFTIMDSDFGQPSYNGFKIKYFNDNLAVLPIPKAGDAVVLCQIKVTQYNGSVTGLCSHNDRAPWTIFSRPASGGRKLSINSSPGSSTRTAAENAYVHSLLNLKEGSAPQSRSITTTPAIPTAPTAPVVTPRQSDSTQGPSPKFSLIKDVTMNTFVDLVVQVVKTYYEDERFQLYVTDYTSNKALFDYVQNADGDGRDGDEYNYTSRYRRPWPGPFGKMTLQVTLWNPHSFYARQNIKVEDLVLLENVHIKIGHSGVARLEGVIHTDRHYPEKIGVIPLNDDRDNGHLRDVIKRKLEYWKRLKTENTQLKNGPENTKRKPAEGEKLSATARKKQRKENRGKEQATAAPAAQDKNLSLNPNVRVHHIAVPYRTISDILHNESHNNRTPDGIEYRLPFQNVRYRTRLRVVDFFPHRLEDFAVPYKKEFDYLSDIETDHEAELDNEHGQVSWEWRFCLLVEDGVPTTQKTKDKPKERMELLAAKADAEFLLNMTAVDLKQDSEALSQLRERLFLLWGDLEEKKQANPENFSVDEPGMSVSAMPFACCIKEYGVKVKGPDADDSAEERDEQNVLLGWKRRFRIFGTTIS